MGLVGGFLSGRIILAWHLQGCLSGGDNSLLQTGLAGIIVYAVLGGAIGGGLFAFLNNRVLGKRHGLLVVTEHE